MSLYSSQISTSVLRSSLFKCSVLNDFRNKSNLFESMLLMFLLKLLFSEIGSKGIFILLILTDFSLVFKIDVNATEFY